MVASGLPWGELGLRMGGRGALEDHRAPWSGYFWYPPSRAVLFAASWLSFSA